MTWIFMPSSCLPASACSERDCEPGSDTWASRLAQSATLSGKLTQPQSWRRAFKKAAWTRLLSGATFAPSTLTSGLEPWIASLRAFRAKTSAWPASAPDLTAPDLGFSSRSCASHVIAVRNGSFWRTSQASLLPPPPLWTKPKGLSKSAPPPESWESWPISGGIRSGLLFPRPTWAPAMGGRGGSVWHGKQAWTTPQAHDVTERGSGQQPTVVAGNACLARDARMWTAPTALERSGQGERNRALVLDVKLWQTPKAGEEESGSGLNGRGEPKLKAQAMRWAMPDCNASSYSNGARGPNIREQAALWETVTTSEHAGAGAGPKKTGGENLRSQAKQWPTPNAHVIEHKSKPPIVDGSRQPSDPQISAADFAVHVFSPPAQQTPPGQESSSAGPTSPRRLNPTFLEWLMGWPIGWTIAEPSASSAAGTALWRRKLLRHLSHFIGD